MVDDRIEKLTVIETDSQIELKVILRLIKNNEERFQYTLENAIMYLQLNGYWNKFGNVIKDPVLINISERRRQGSFIFETKECITQNLKQTHSPNPFRRTKKKIIEKFEKKDDE